MNQKIITPAIPEDQFNKSLRTITNKQREKFSRPLSEECKFRLHSVCSIKHPETILLLKQSVSTITHAEKSLAKFNFVDTYVLLRSSLEFLTNAVIVEKDDEAYSEFVSLTPLDERPKRNKTQPTKLITSFAQFLYSNYPDFALADTEEDCISTLTQLYSLLCHYTHASIIVATISNVDNIDKNEHIRMLMQITLHQVKWYLYLTIMHFVGSEPTITLENAGKAYIIQILKTILWMTQHKINYTKQNDELYLNTMNIKFKNSSLHEYNKILEEIKADNLSETDFQNAIQKIVQDYLKN